jgi:predicted aldo/keto reductase-like oxidoreductase
MLRSHSLSVKINIMQNRRKFLKNSLLTVTGAGLASKALAGATRFPGPEEKKFIYRTLGRTGIKLPIVSMGTGNCDNANLVSTALDEGVKLIATSEAYQNGNNELMVGEATKDRPRDSYIIMTSSADMEWIDSQAGLYKPFDPDEFVERTYGCLERLHVDYLDIFILAFAARRESVFFEPALKAMKTIKKKGIAKYLGIATHKFEHEAIRAAADADIFDVVMTAYNFRRQNREEIDEALDYATDAGLGIIAMKTMAGAYWDRERTKPINTKAALKWVLQNENIHTSVPDCSSFDQLYQDLAIMGDLELTDEEKLDLEPPSEELSSGLYCQQCNKCIPQCPEAIDIPTVMRSYMYAYGYRNLDLAHKTLRSSGLSSLPCVNCSDCKVTCQMGFDVRKKILDITRLKDVPEDFIRRV